MKKEQKNSPNLRFKGFTEDWELCKLGDITESFSGGTPQAGNSDYYDGEIPFIRSGEINDSQTELFITEKGLNNSSAKIVEKGDILYALYGATSGEVGISQINGAINQAILAIRPIKEDEPYLIAQWLLKQKESIIRTYLQGGQGNLSSSIVKELVLKLPKDKAEQAKIGTFFKQLDDTITLHQRKLEQLKELKKAYLQVMFPAKDERVPKVRFAAFEGEWAHRKLGEITESFSGGTPTVGKSEYYGGDIPFIRSGEISSDSTELFITENGLNSSSAKMVKVGDILYALYGATSGEVGISKITGAINQAILAIRPSKNDNSYLIIQWLRKQKNTIISTYLQGGQGNLSSSIVKNLIIMLPQNKEEQEKVGIFFKRLDDIITLHQNKLEQLKDLKTSYLQNMFI
ncbi:restriction endonuclease subunit S [Enterococcus faecalis]|uniref:restriction endonuclease subunit S n=1 Tax=Enterococcus faecalis TaxID=1351 RepID=UPI0009FABB67|nr:restriction endonuclease subunit S [Enterococcus faecalis]EGO8268660.1 restriction endonuclease subunit S [Enterococcus faecalis]ORE52755.1 restriction endonuclease subunit S [Enterococcus faecalis]